MNYIEVMCQEKVEMIPKEFFVTSGKALSPVSELNAFDLALEKAGIGQCNLVPVSSILPPNCEEKRWRKIPVGSITHAVVARMDGSARTTVGAGIAWAWEKDKKDGLVAEAHGYVNRRALKDTLEWKIMEMAKVRGIEIDEISYRMEALRVPMDNYGCVIAALVYSS